MYLIVDTESNGLPKDYQGKITDVDNWPRVTQIAWRRYDATRTLIKNKSFLIKPDGWVVPKEKFFIDNGMSTERCEELGIPAPLVLAEFVFDLSQCDYIIAHNLNFDFPIIYAELLRYNLTCDKGVKGICTKKQGYKWPKLEELHERLFGDKPSGNTHDAGYDVEVTAYCFFAMLDNGIIKL